jgi:Bacterial Ig domain/Phosphoesterase family/Cadherin-like domain
MKFILNKIILGTALSVFAFGTASVQAQSANFTGSYTQNFDSIPGTTGTTLPPGFTSMVIAGGNGTYSAASPINAAGIASATADTQTLTIWNAGTKVTDNGSISYNIGCWDSLNDRALGTDPTGTGAQVIQLALTNTTGSTLYGLTFSYDCKCMTNGSVGTEESELPGYCFFYSTTGTAAAGNWTEVGVAGNAALVGGVPTANGLCLPNFTQATTMNSGPVNITFATPLTNNGVMYFRWADDNNVANSPDQMVAIDDISVATYTPAGPTVSITSPASGSTVGAGSITLQASASDLTGTVTNVSYYSGSTFLGQATTAPYTVIWANVQGGSYSLTAQAQDNNGLMATSSVVSITITNPLTASFTGVYTQNFDADLANNSTLMPPGFAAMSLAGSHFTYTNAPGQLLDSNAIVTATIGGNTLIVWNVGSPVTDAASQLFNIGSWDGLGDRALGTDPTGTGGTVIQLALTNNTGAALAGVVYSYTEKCLTNGSTSNGSFTDDGTERLELPGYEFFYSITGDNNASNWFEAPVLSATNWVEDTVSNAGPVTLIFPQPLANGAIMYFRWADDNCVASSPDQMYGIDNISITSFNPNGPQISFESPTNNENIIPGTAFTVSVNATDNTGTITNVTLYLDGSPVYTFPSAPYILPVPGSELPAGQYTVTAVATDDAGLSATSAVVNLSIAFVPPTVALTNPASASSFPAPATILLSASAASTDGTITNVAFYAGTTLLANIATSPYIYTWANVTAGSYALTALAADSHGLTSTSSVVSITVTNGFGLPVVTITSPANNASFAPGSNVSIAANAGEDGGTITNVEFYANGTDLGGSAASPYGVTWPNVALGNYALTAVAADNSGNMATSAVVNVTVAVQHLPPMVSLTSPTNNAAPDVYPGLLLSATASTSNGTVTNVAFYINTFLVANVASAPYNYNLSNAPTGDYTVTAVATDNTGISSTSAVANVTAINSASLATLKQIKTIFVIPLENHDFVQANPQGSPQQLLGNPACPYFNSLITPNNSNSVQTAYATHYFSCAIGGEHPSEPNYLWAEAGTDFGVRTDNDPSSSSHNIFNNVPHLSGQLTAGGIAWSNYQEDVEFSSSEEVSASGSGTVTNAYNGTTQYNYAVKHNPMAFFADTQNENCYPLTNLWADLANNTVGRYNWITPDQYNEMHSSLPSGYTYHGVAYTGDQAAIAEGDNALSIIIPKIMASQAYKDHGVIIIWTDETESTDDTNTTLPYVIISSLARGNAYASTLAYSHSSDLKTMDEIFGLAFQTNAIPNGWVDAQNTGYNYVNGSSAIINDLSDFFQPAHVPPVANPVSYTRAANLPLVIPITNLLGNVTSIYGDPITLVGVGTDGLNLLTTNGATLVNNGSYILYTNSVTPNVNDSFEYTVSDGQGGTNAGTVSIVINNNLFGQTSPQLSMTSTNTTVTFFGIPGYSYIVDRSTNMVMGAGWVPISTNVAPSSGVIQILDNFQDLGIPIPPLPPAVFYRLQYNP